MARLARCLLTVQVKAPQGGGQEPQTGARPGIGKVWACCRDAIERPAPFCIEMSELCEDHQHDAP